MNHSSIDPELDTYNQLKKKWRRVRLEMEKRDTKDRDRNGARVGNEI
jgi:hypothetical protein